MLYFFKIIVIDSKTRKFDSAYDDKLYFRRINYRDVHGQNSKSDPNLIRSDLKSKNSMKIRYFFSTLRISGIRIGSYFYFCDPCTSRLYTITLIICNHCNFPSHPIEFLLQSKVFFILFYPNKYSIKCCWKKSIFFHDLLAWKLSMHCAVVDFSRTLMVIIG